MAEQSKIAWTHSTFNPWIGCTKVGPGCDNCYAENLDSRKRWGGVIHWGAGVQRHHTSVSTWKAPLAWNRKAAESGKPWRVFCASLADVFDNEVDPSWRCDLFNLIEATPALTWLLLTKRIGNVPRMAEVGAPYGRLAPNIWLGATIVNQEEWNRDREKLFEVDAAVRFVSYEPALGPVKWGTRLPDWIIVGGESGAQARAFEPEWARSTIRQCREAGAAPFVKQLGTRPQEIAYPTDVTKTEERVWWADHWTHIISDRGEHWRRYWRLKDRAGADPDEWPEDLRVQEFPVAHLSRAG